MQSVQRPWGLEMTLSVADSLRTFLGWGVAEEEASSLWPSSPAEPASRLLFPLHRRRKPARAAGTSLLEGRPQGGPRPTPRLSPPTPATQEVVSVTETDLRLQAVCVIRPVVCKPVQRCLMGLWHGDGGTIKENKAKVHGG